MENNQFMLSQEYMERIITELQQMNDKLQDILNIQEQEATHGTN